MLAIYVFFEKNVGNRLFYFIRFYDTLTQFKSYGAETAKTMFANLGYYIL
jgi:hypothetical protein